MDESPTRSRFQWIWWVVFVVVAACAIAWYLFVRQQAAVIPAPSTSSSSSPNQGGTFTPPGYVPPTGIPHVNGPSGPPPGSE